MQAHAREEERRGMVQLRPPAFFLSICSGGAPLSEPVAQQGRFPEG